MNTIKILLEKEFDEAFRLTSYAFHKPDTPERREAFHYLLAHSTTFADYTENRLTSSLTQTPFQIQLYGRTVQADGIGYVASYPEARGNGAVKRLFEKLAHTQKEMGCLLSILDPFSYGFYENFGYTHLYNHLSLSWKSVDFPRARKTKGTMKRCSLEQGLKDLQTVYENSADFSRASMKRETWWWQYWYKYRLPEVNLALFYDEKGIAKGYVLYLFKEMTFEIHEWVTLDTESFFATMQFIQSHAGAFETFTYRTHCPEISELAIYRYMREKRQVKIEVTPFMQAKIIDFQAFLEILPPTVFPHSFVFEVSDVMNKWNNGTFTFGAPSQSLVHVKGDITAFTAWFLGYATLADLLFLEKIFVTENPPKDVLEGKWARVPILADYF